MQASHAMNPTQLKCLAAMFVLALIGFGPVSLTCLAGLYVVAFRPMGFLALTRKMYQNGKNSHRVNITEGARVARLKAFLILLVLFLLDVAPVPITGSIGLFVILTRPLWFLSLIEAIYSSTG